MTKSYFAAFNGKRALHVEAPDAAAVLAWLPTVTREPEGYRVTPMVHEPKTVFARIGGAR